MEEYAQIDSGPAGGGGREDSRSESSEGEDSMDLYGHTGGAKLRVQIPGGE